MSIMQLVMFTFAAINLHKKDADNHSKNSTSLSSFEKHFLSHYSSCELDSDIPHKSDLHRSAVRKVLARGLSSELATCLPDVSLPN